MLNLPFANGSINSEVRCYLRIHINIVVLLAISLYLIL